MGKSDFMAMTKKIESGQMVRQQIMTNHVTDQRVIEAMAEVPREAFVPTDYVGSAYIDADIPLGARRVIIEPMVLARLLQLAEIKPDSRVLDVGCATGYSTAVISKIASMVYGIESDESLAALASRNMEKQKISNARIAIANLADGSSVSAPYDAVVIAGGAEIVPVELEKQLKQGGRIVLVHVNGNNPAARIRLGIKNKDMVSYRDYFDTGWRLLPGLEKTAEFKF